MESNASPEKYLGVTNLLVGGGRDMELQWGFKGFSPAEGIAKLAFYVILAVKTMV